METSPPTPLQSQRKICHNAKDVYWKCLDENNNDEQTCAQTKREFENSCPKQWMEYFVKRRKFNEFRELQDKLGYVRQRHN